jgi:hypothetical protein
VKNPTDKSKHIRLEIDTTGDKKRNELTHRTISDKRWTLKRHDFGGHGPVHMRACVVTDKSGPCLSRYATSWWPVKNRP